VKLAPHCACIVDDDGKAIAPCWAHLKRLERSVPAAMRWAFDAITERKAA